MDIAGLVMNAGPGRKKFSPHAEERGSPRLLPPVPREYWHRTDARDFDGIASFGAGLRFLSWGSFERANELGERDGTFSAGDLALTVGAAREYSERIRYGASVHFVYSSIESYRASALAADLGATYLLPESQFSASVSLNNIGVTVDSFGENRDELPFDVRVGVAKKLRYLPLLVTVTAYDLQNVGDAPEGASGLGSVFQYLNFFDANGGLHYEGSFSYHGKAIGQTSGWKWVYHGAGSSTFYIGPEEPYPYVYTGRYTDTLQGTGGAPTYSFSGLRKLTINANGELTVDRYVSEVVCD